MSIEGHVKALKEKKTEIEKQITEAEQSPGYDDLELQHLKREKLRIKDELYALGVA